MLRIHLGTDGLARTRFAISPLRVAGELLYTFAYRPYLLSRQWRSRASQVLEYPGLELLAALSGPNTHFHYYAADFINPEPATFHNDLEQELHQVATTATERVGYEMQIALTGRPTEPATPTRSTQAVLLKAAQRGEHDLAQQAAAQLEQFWKLALAPHWPQIQQELEDDVAARATITARNGFDQMINGLGPGLAWRDGGLDIGPVSVADELTSEALILTPSPFISGYIYSIDTGDAPEVRIPTLSYRAVRSPSGPRPPLDELIGTTRAHLLAALTTPHTTSELAERLHLSRSTVSYHLQILHRAGLLHRTHHNRAVQYQRAGCTVMPGSSLALGEAGWSGG
ncbi:hypothetical protein ABH926_010345 [Catenulispora sp. GP43]|uniref:ArsR/SmtB family transcription factor n=1 Tax=Catenulispora sp. GP43 TaxID=3156263 RepID=UPI003516A93C